MLLGDAKWEQVGENNVHVERRNPAGEPCAAVLIC